jgi:hypothetical protein
VGQPGEPDLMVVYNENGTPRAKLIGDGSARDFGAAIWRAQLGCHALAACFHKPVWLLGLGQPHVVHARASPIHRLAKADQGLRALAEQLYKRFGAAGD